MFCMIFNYASFIYSIHTNKSLFLSDWSLVGYDMQFDIKYAYYNFLQSINLYGLSAVASTQEEDMHHTEQNLTTCRP